VRLSGPVATMRPPIMAVRRADMLAGIALVTE
jgi:hypothetical protein